MAGGPSDFIQFIRPGWIEVGHTRMCLLEIEGGFYRLRRNLRISVGMHEKEMIYQAGMEGSSNFMQNGIATQQFGADANGFRMALKAYSDAGFGDFHTESIDWPSFRATLIGRETFEGWAFQKRKDFNKECCCDYTRGVVSSFMLFSHNPTQDELDRFACVETHCVGKGDRECRFELGFRESLEKEGFAIPPPVLSHREELELAMGRARKALDEKNEGMKKLLYGLMHDLKSPLISMHGFANLLLDQPRKKVPEEERRHLLQRIVFNARFMEDMIQGLLDVYLLDQEEDIPTMKESIDVPPLLENILRDKADEISASEIRVKTDFAPKVPSISYPPLWLEKLFLNLLSEAIFASPMKGGRLGIQVRTEKERLLVSLTYETAPGPKSFGLSMAKKIVDKHGGKIDSAEGQITFSKKI